jgi:hypothetical protein
MSPVQTIRDIIFQIIEDRSTQHVVVFMVLLGLFICLLYLGVSYTGKCMPMPTLPAKAKADFNI